MISGTYAAVSGLQADATRVANNANNVANMNTDGFKKARGILSEKIPQGVGTTVERVGTPGPVALEATARGEEMVEQSNVDLNEEIPELLLNRHGYDANLKTITMADDMVRTLLDLKA